LLRVELFVEEWPSKTQQHMGGPAVVPKQVLDRGGG
jgi:hypothetical protein